MMRIVGCRLGTFSYYQVLQQRYGSSRHSINAADYKHSTELTNCRMSTHNTSQYQYSLQ